MVEPFLDAALPDEAACMELRRQDAAFHLLLLCRDAAALQRHATHRLFHSWADAALTQAYSLAPCDPNFAPLTLENARYGQLWATLVDRLQRSAPIRELVATLQPLNVSDAAMHA